MAEMKDLLTQLAQARELAEVAKQIKLELLERLHASPEYQNALANANSTADAVASLEFQVRQEALHLHDVSGAKIGAGWKIKTFHVATIQEDRREELKDWCLTHFTPALQLNEKLIEKAAIQGTIPNYMVPVVDVHKVYIDVNLSLLDLHPAEVKGE